MPKRNREGEGKETAARPTKVAKSNDARSATAKRPDRTFETISRELGVRIAQVRAVARLVDEGSTIPFIARYRKEATGGLTDDQLRQFQKRLISLDRLESRRSSILKTLDDRGVLTDRLAKSIEGADDLTTLEDAYLPYKEKRATKASAARLRGLEPLADAILKGTLTDALKNTFCVSPPFPTFDSALGGARAIISERASEIPFCRDFARSTIQKSGKLAVKATKIALATDQSKKQSETKGRGKVSGSCRTGSAATARNYERYFDFECLVRTIKPHQVLAVNRGESLGFLNVKLIWDTDKVARLCLEKVSGGRKLPGKCQEQVHLAVEDGIKRLLKPCIERDIRRQLEHQAMHSATQTFSKNLTKLLLGPPLPDTTVLGIDPGYRTGCKIAVCSPSGSVLTTTTIHATPPASNTQKRRAKDTMMSLVRQYGVQAVAIGDGTGSREAEEFVCEVLKGVDVRWCVESECGASVYSASELAAGELRGMDVSLRGAVSIARRLQDPLAELVKIEPHHLGVGLYQHDIKQSLLSSELKNVVESAVNLVGVDLNTASPSLLSYVAGLSLPLSKQIVQYREQHGQFNSRQELQNVKGLGPKIFEQCAGFLRIRNGDNVLDSTAVHPESYKAAWKLLGLCNGGGCKGGEIGVGQLKEAKEKLGGVSGDQMDLWADQVGIGKPTLVDMIEALCNPGRDVRGRMTTTMLKKDRVGSITDLKVGMKLNGTVRNVVGFGAFVDVNVGRDGLIPVSGMSEYVTKGKGFDVHDVVSVGDRVSVEVVDVDLVRKRIGLKLVSCDEQGR